MNTVAIVGVGLIGGSFGLALRQAGFDGEILGVSSPATLDAAAAIGAISRAATLDEAALSADLIYLAQPVDRILATIEVLGPLAPANCLITDAGSTKSAIVRKAAHCLRRAAFLGGHPMAGKEQRGVEAADALLFRGRPYVLTPNAAESPASRDFRSWLTRIEALIIDMPPQEHDAAVAFTSHLPQLLSTALAATLGKQPNPYIARVFGNGLLDMTRLALSSPDLWLSILDTNRAEVGKALDALLASLVELKARLEHNNLTDLFSAASNFASEIRRADCN